MLTTERMERRFKLWKAGLVFAALLIILGQQQYISKLTEERDVHALALRASVNQSLLTLHVLAQQDALLERSVELLSRLHDELAARQISERIRACCKKSPHPARTAAAIVETARRYGLDPYWWAAQIEQESHYRPGAIGAAGERGLAQISKSTARVLALPWGRAFSVEENLDAGARYMAQHLETYQGNVHRALLRYNGGGAQYPRLVSARHAALIRNNGV